MLNRSKTILLSLVLAGSNAWAKDDPQLVLDNVQLNLSAQEWVETQSAKVTVAVNAVLGRNDLVKLRQNIMSNLNKISSAKWHITQFDRSQDNSGLEKLYATASARINQSDLTDLYANAKSVSKPGASYKVLSVQFKPSLQEIEKTKHKLRQNLYAQVMQELKLINQQSPQQSYSIHSIRFVDALPVSNNYQPRAKQTMMLAAESASPSVAVSNRLTMSAVVDLASNRQDKD